MVFVARFLVILALIPLLFSKTLFFFLLSVAQILVAFLALLPHLLNMLLTSILQLFSLLLMPDMMRVDMLLCMCRIGLDRLQFDGRLLAEISFLPVPVFMNLGFLAIIFAIDLFWFP